jgi:hypothetical protein
MQALINLHPFLPFSLIFSSMPSPLHLHHPNFKAKEYFKVIMVKFIKGES